ncbi:MAG: tRNA (5-methylaminomethyl-2-thiouridine)(34)-methyltransferase MnmD, partial [Thalassolituus sp.]
MSNSGEQNPETRKTLETQKAPETSKALVQSPVLSWNDDGLPIADAFDDPYFSVENGLEETRYVFLKNNGLPQRFAEGTGPFRIIETGFGTGLNFLATWQAFTQEATPERWLHFTSVEKFPLTPEQLTKALALWPELADLSQKLIDRYPPATPGFHVLSWPEERVTLTLIFADVHDAFPELNGPVDAWYLDGFAPSKNPAMWSDELFKEIRRISRNPLPDRIPTVATFTAAGLVRRGLKGAGFQVAKVPGFGRKREMLAGSYNATTGPEKSELHNRLPWQLTPEPLKYGSHVVVAGAGLAGCTTARALAERGFKVTLCDPDGIANGASGNPQGGLYIKLAADDQATHSDFYRQAYLLALKEVRRVLGEGSKGEYWNDCGVLQLAYDEKEAKRQQRFIERHMPPETLVTTALLDRQPNEQSDKQHNGQHGLLYPSAGWVSPSDFCNALAQH